MTNMIFLTDGEVTHGTKCPTHKLEIKKMTEIHIAKVLIEGDTATIMGVKYKRVEEPKPETLYDALDKLDKPMFIDDVCRVVEEWLPDDDPNDGEEYQLGWNACLKFMREKIR